MNLHDDVSAEQIHEHIRGISKLSFSRYSLALRVEIGVHPDLVCGNKIGYKPHKSFPRPGIELSYTLPGNKGACWLFVPRVRNKPCRRALL